MRVLHVVDSIESEAAGPSVSVPGLAEAQARLGAEVTLATIGDATAAQFTRTTVPLTIYPQTGASVPIISAVRLSRCLNAMLSANPPGFDVVHSHGLWLASNVYPARAGRNGALWVVSPRGMLGPAALKFSALRKKAFWHLVQRPALRYAGLIHATAEEEACEARNAGIKAPVVVVPNGVVLPALEGRRSPRRQILSLGRLHPKKGLDRLVEAWALIAHRYPDWRVVIAGPDEGGHGAELLKHIERVAVPRITVEGPVFGAAKEAAYRQAGIFVLPTLHENFAMTVAEALAAETPVISTKGAPWAGLQSHGCGLWIDHGPGPLAAALSKLIDLGDEGRTRMGERGRAWMAAEFSWDRVGSSLLAAYSQHLR